MTSSASDDSAGTALPFDRAEYGARLARTRAAMEAAGLDTLLVSDPSNMAWLTGYDGWSFYTHQAVIVPGDGDPVWWGRAMDARGARRTVWMDDDAIVGYEDHYVQNPDHHPMEALCGLLAERGLARGRIGVEMDNYYYSAKAHQTLAGRLDGCDLVDAEGLVNWRRAVKSPAELAFMRRAARIVQTMHGMIAEIAEPGLAKHLLVAEIMKAGTLGADGHWGDYPAIMPLTPSGMDATAPHLTWDDRPMRTGEATFFEIAGVCRRYHCPQSRTVFLGTPPQRYRDAERAVLSAVDAGIAAAEPGRTCGDMADAFFDTLEAHGFSKESRAGYSIGLSYPPDWGERTMSIRRGDPTVLEPGMTLHFMPALWLDDGGLEITEPIVITETGAQCLTETPRRLVVK